MTKKDLSGLDYPRHVHKLTGSVIVNNVAECEAALKDGYTVECPPPADSPLGMAAAVAAVSAPDPSSSATDPAPSSPAPKKKGVIAALKGH